MLKKIMVAVLALTFALGFASIAAAADVKVGGSLRTEITWAYYDDEASATGDSNFVFDQFHISSSRLKFTYLSDDKKFKGYAELRLRSRSAGLNVDVRHAYFSYSWDGGSILFGQTGGMGESYFPSQWLDSANCIIGYGKRWFDRLEQIRLMMGDKYKLKLAIEGPSKRNDMENIDGDAGISYRYFPAFAAALDLNFGNVNVYPWIRWEWERAYIGDEDINWHSLEFGLEINGDFGLVGFTVAAGYGINAASAGNLGNTYPVFDATWDEKSDHKSLNVFGELRVGGLSIGGGYINASRDDLDGTELWANDPYKAAVYANYKIPFGKITFIPEIVWENEGEDSDGNDLGNAFKVGLFAMLNF
jgi:hypothetical protein